MNNLEKILGSLRRGNMVIVVDDSDRENEGDLLVAGEKITPEHIAFMAAYGRGLICVPITKKRADQLKLPPMTENNTALLRCNFTVSVDVKKGITTGISAPDRAKTIFALVDSKTKASDLARPGHLFPLVANEAGLTGRRGHTEAAVELMQMASLDPVGVICEIMGDDGTMLSGKKLTAFAKLHKLPIISIQEIVDGTKAKSKKTGKKSSAPFVSRKLVHPEVMAHLSTQYGKFHIVGYSNTEDAKEHVALIMGDISGKKPVLVRVHSECLTGDVFHSLRCDCQPQLDGALKRISQNGSGVLLYMRDEGRGIGLINKLKAYNLQDKGYDTAEANLKLGFKTDERSHSLAAQILLDLGVSKVNLMTNNPDKITELKRQGIKVASRVPLEIVPRGKRDRAYLKTKKNKLGHLLSNL